MEYTIKIFPDPEGDGDYIAEVEELYGCSAFCESPEIALQEIETAIQLWLETAKIHGKPIPLPKGSKIKDPKNVLTLFFRNLY